MQPSTFPYSNRQTKTTTANAITKSLLTEQSRPTSSKDVRSLTMRPRSSPRLGKLVVYQRSSTVNHWVLNAYSPICLMVTLGLSLSWRHRASLEAFFITHKTADLWSRQFLSTSLNLWSQFWRITMSTWSLTLKASSVKCWASTKWSFTGKSKSFKRKFTFA